MFTTHRVRAALGIAALTGALLSGCGGDSPDPQSDPSASTSSTASPTGSGSPTTSESTSTEAATGDEVATSFFTMRMPEGYPARSLGKDFAYSAYEKGTSNGVSINITDTYGNPRFSTLDGAAKLTLQSLPGTGKPKRVDDTEIAGEPAYQFSGKDGRLDLEVIGALHDGQNVSVSFSLEGTPEERQAIVDSVLASWQWK